MDLAEARNRLDAKPEEIPDEAIRSLGELGNAQQDLLLLSDLILASENRAQKESAQAAFDAIKRRLTAPAAGEAPASETAAQAPGAGASPGETAGARPESISLQPARDMATEIGKGVKESLEKVREITERQVNLMNLNRELTAWKTERDGLFARLGQRAFEAFSKLEPSGDDALDPVIVEGVKAVAAFHRQIAEKQTEESAVVAEEPDGGFLDRLKVGIAKMAGYVKLKLDVSRLETRLDLRVQTFGHTIWDKREDLRPLLAGTGGFDDLLASLTNLEKKIRDREDEIHRLE